MLTGPRTAGDPVPAGVSRRVTLALGVATAIGAVTALTPTPAHASAGAPASTPREARAAGPECMADLGEG